MRNEDDAASFKACWLVVDRPIDLNRLTVEAGRVHGFNGTGVELQKRLKDHIKAVTGVKQEPRCAGRGARLDVLVRFVLSIQLFALMQISPYPWGLFSPPPVA